MVDCTPKEKIDGTVNGIVFGALSPLLFAVSALGGKEGLQAYRDERDALKQNPYANDGMIAGSLISGAMTGGAEAIGRKLITNGVTETLNPSVNDINSQTCSLPNKQSSKEAAEKH